MKRQLIEIFITYRNDYIKNTTTVKLIFVKRLFYEQIAGEEARAHIFIPHIFVFIISVAAFISGQKIYGTENGFNALQVF